MKQRNTRNNLQNFLIRQKLKQTQQVQAEKLQNLTGDERRKQMGQKIQKMANKRSKKIAPPNLAVEAPFLPPVVIEFEVPNWFRKPKNVDVSIIVPLYRSKQDIKSQIENWDFTDDGLSKEIIYVDDCCPDKSHLQVMEMWEQQKQKVSNGVGRILLHNRNGGFAYACNSGAKFSSGKYLIFLNADCTVTANWVKPMIDLMQEDFSIGLVGNLHLRPKGSVDSAGSEWSSNSFKHIGRNVYHGKNLPAPFTYQTLPDDLKKPGERQMVTGACFAIRRDVFKRVLGFDTAYRIGYWEDADLNMKVRATGLKIYYQPDSVIYHKVGHSRAGGHRFLSQNQKLFYSKWVGNNFHSLLTLNNPPPRESDVSDLVRLKNKLTNKIVGCVIACNEEEFIEVSVDSLAPIVDEWIFVIGGNEFAHRAGMCNKDGFPTDNTMDIVKNLAKKYQSKIIEPHGLWKNKIQMRSAYAQLLRPGDWMFLQDADEVYTCDQLEKILQVMQQYEAIKMQYWSFWNNVNTLGTGRWDQYPCERIIRWQSGFGYYNSHLNVNTQSGQIVLNVSKKRWFGNDRLFHHYSWIRPLKKLRQKLLYYKYQSGNNNDSYIDDVFLKWRTDPESVRGKTHPMGGGDFSPFLGKHPPGVEALIQQGKLDF